MPRPLLRSLTLGLIFTVLPVAVASTAAQTGLSITTPYPSVSVQPGASVTMTVTVAVRQSSRVALALQGLPNGWHGSLSGGGQRVHAVFVQARHACRCHADDRGA